MARKAFVGLLAVAAVSVVATLFAEMKMDKTYKVTATAIEGCSCPLFCSCCYNTEPSDGHMCQFNNAYKFDAGSHWGSVDISDTKVWVSGDLGSHYGDGTTEWAVITFDKAVTPEQRGAINSWIGNTFPVEWGSVAVREDDISWSNDERTADAKLASGMASLHLDKVFDSHGEQSTAMNTAYWASDSNTGFKLAHSTHHFDGEPSFSFEGRNGFVVTMTSEGTLEE